MDIAGGKFVVTGGAGFIGSYVVDRLLREGAAEVIVIDTLVRGGLHNLTEALGDPRCRHVIADIRFPHEIDPYFEGARGVFHLATLRITQCAAEPRRALEVMVDGTYNVAEACVKHKVGKLVFSSSASIYGMADSFPTLESHHPYNNDTWYGATKVLGEGLLASFRSMYGLDSTTLRYFNVYGPRMDIYGKYTEVLMRWIDCFEAGERPKIFGDGQQTMDFIYVEDCARANILAMKASPKDPAFNIATGAETSLAGLLDQLRASYGGPTLDPEFLPARAVNPVPRRLAAVEAAREQIGFLPETDLAEGLRKLIEWRRGAKRAAAE